MTSDRGPLTRREALRIAVAAGGSAGLSACLNLEGRSGDGTDPADGTRRPTDGEANPEPPARQHAWHEFSGTDDHGNPTLARHHVLLLADHVDGGPVDDAARTRAETAFRELERAYGWSADGLLFTVGYSPSYFDRYDRSLPDSVDLPPPEALAPFEDPALDTPDLLVHLASNSASTVVAAERALFGDAEAAGGTEVGETVEGVLERVDRRTGFIGAGLPAERDDVNGVPDGAVPEDAPLR